MMYMSIDPLVSHSRQAALMRSNGIEAACRLPGASGNKNTVAEGGRWLIPVLDYPVHIFPQRWQTVQMLERMKS